MPRNSADLFKAAASKIKEARTLQEKADSENRDITAEEDTNINTILAEADGLRKQAETRRKVELAVDSLDDPIEPPVAVEHDPAKIYAEAKDHNEEGRAGFKSFGEMAMAVYRSHPQINGGFDNRLRPLAASGMNQAIGAEGGFLVPAEFNKTIWDGFNQVPDNLLARTDQYTVTGESLTMVANAETARTVGNRWGGIRGYWKAEAAQMTSSKPTLREIKLEPQELYVFAYVTDKLLKNSSVALDQYLARAAASEIAFLTGDAIINGTGAGQPKGILNAASLVSVAKETGQTAATIVTENIVKMHARLHPISRPDAIWLTNPDIEPQLNMLSIGVGAAGMPAYLPPGGLSAAPYGTLLGKPVIPCEYCATLGTVGDILLVDLKAYASATSGGIESALSIHLRFDYAETAFRFIFACDGQPWLASAITPFKGSNTLSPFVALATRA